MRAQTPRLITLRPQVVFMVLLALCVAACGSGGKTHGTRTPTKPAKTKTGPSGKKPPVKTASCPSQGTGGGPKLQAEAVGSHGKTPLGSTVKTGPTEVVVIEATPPSHHSTAKVKLCIDGKSGSTLHVAATMHAKTSVATIRSSHGGQIALESLRYVCHVPPAKTFCPPKSARADAGRYLLTFKVPAGVPVVLRATVKRGPQPLPSAVAAAGTQTQAPFKVQQTLVVEDGSHGSKPSQSVEADRGQSVDMITTIEGSKSAAPQLVTVNIPRASATSLSISASAAGGKPSRAVIKSIRGRNIRVISPRFLCYAPPVRDFCPIVHSKTTSTAYQVTFRAAPGIPITLFGIIGPLT